MKHRDRFFSRTTHCCCSSGVAFYIFPWTSVDTLFKGVLWLPLSQWQLPFGFYIFYILITLIMVLISCSFRGIFIVQGNDTIWAPSIVFVFFFNNFIPHCWYKQLQALSQHFHWLYRHRSGHPQSSGRSLFIHLFIFPHSGYFGYFFPPGTQNTKTHRN